MDQPSTPPRILYAAGPGDVVGTYQYWKQGQDDPAQMAVTYSGQFYDFCRETGSPGYIISHHTRQEKITDGNLTIEHRPLRFMRGPAVLYHLEQVWYGLKLTASAVRFKADVAVVAEGTHWFILGFMRWFGIQVVPTLHCVLWPKLRKPRGPLNKIIWTLNGWFFRRRASVVMSLSADITQQLGKLMGENATTPIVAFLPIYRPQAFGEGFGPPPADGHFRVFFAGRIERNKGVFDLLEIAKRFAAENRLDIEFDLCGDGSQLQSLQTAALAAGVADRFHCHGHTDKTFMRNMYERCHIVVVPTSSNFNEGFNKVVVEGVLAGRPVVTSEVCPALEYVKDAVVAVPPDDTNAYGNAILHLKEDRHGLYESKRAACSGVRDNFYDPGLGWKAALAKAVEICMD